MNLQEFKHTATTKFENHFDVYVSSAEDFANEHRAELKDYHVLGKFKDLRTNYVRKTFPIYLELLRTLDSNKLEEKDWIEGQQHITNLEIEFFDKALKKESEILN